MRRRSCADRNRWLRAISTGAPSRKGWRRSINRFATGRSPKDGSCMTATWKARPRWRCWGETVARNLFGNDDPIEAVIRIRNIPFRVVGVLVPKGQTGQGQDQDDTVMIPYTTMQKRLMRITCVQSIVGQGRQRRTRARGAGTNHGLVAPAAPHRVQIERTISPCAICPISPKRRRPAPG